jgi:hypothetical protein
MYVAEANIGPNYAVMDDFNLASDSIVNSISFRGLVWPDQQLVSQIDWAICANINDTYYNYSGAELFSGVGTGFTVTPTGYGVGSRYPVNDYTFSVGNLDLSAGTYWLKLGNAQAGGSKTYIELGAAHPYNPNSAIQFSGSIRYGIGQNGNMVFSLDGTTNIDHPVPVPPALFLFAPGLVSLIGLKRKYLG